MRPTILTFTASLLVTATNAGAMTLAPSVPQGSTDIVRVADGCGLGFHLNPRGICRPNGERVVVVEPRRVVVERPRVVVERPPVVVERPVVVEPRRVVVEERPVAVEPRRVVVVPPARCGIRVGPVAVGGPC